MTKVLEPKRGPQKSIAKTAAPKRHRQNGIAKTAEPKRQRPNGVVKMSLLALRRSDYNYATDMQLQTSNLRLHILDFVTRGEGYVFISYLEVSFIY